MEWLSILATSHPFLLVVMLVSIFAIVGGTITSIVRRKDDISDIVFILAILWLIIGIGYFFR